MKKKLTQLRWFVTIILFVAAMAMPKMAWAEITPTKPSGEGTAESPYQIGKAAELYWFAALVNGDASVCDYDEVKKPTGIKQDLAAHAILTQNITINKNVLLENGELNTSNESSFEKWTPIGYNTESDSAYTGTFDGKGKTISGLYYSEETSVKTYAGLFGYNQGTISNITIEDSWFYLSSTIKYSSVAAIVGRNDGTVKYCNNTGTINATATDTYYVGGICGYNRNQVTNCNNSGIVNGTEAVNTTCYIGGICGENIGKITDCNNAGKVCLVTNDGASVGGVCGDNYKDGTIDNCHNTADVNVSGNSSEPDFCVGGVCGSNIITDNSHTATIQNCSNAGKITGSRNVGGVCGANQSDIVGCHNSGTVEGTINVGGVCGGQIKFYMAYFYGTITNCYNTGIVKGTSEVGGICGKNYYAGTIENCYSAGSVSGTSDTSNVGGICGHNETVSSKEVGEARSTIRNSYYDNDKYSGDAVGWNGNIGSIYAGILEKVEGKSLDYFSKGGVCYLLNNGTTDGTQVWYQNLSQGGDAYPVMKKTENHTVYKNLLYDGCVCEPGSSTTCCYTNDNKDVYAEHPWNDNGFCANNPSVCQPAELNNGVYKISNAGQLYWFAEVFESKYDTYKNANIVLLNDIVDNDGDVAGCNGVKETTQRQWSAIGKNDDCFQGTFDGHNHAISGLFGDGFIYKNEGTIKNLIVRNSYLTEETWVGGICNFNNSSGTISGCSFSGTLKVKTTDDRAGGYYLGGICGQNNNIIENCHVNDNIKFYTDYSNLEQTLYIGGICGENRYKGKVSNCYSTASIACQTTVSTPIVKSGICGQNKDNAVATNCYYLTGTADCGIGNAVDIEGFTEAVASNQFTSGEVCHLLNGGKAFGSQAWGQNLNYDEYPVLGSKYKVIRAAKGDLDANGEYPYWATFSNQSSDSDLGELNVYTAKVSKGNLTLRLCPDQLIAKGEGVLVKGSSEYLNALMLNTVSETAEANNDLVATPAEPTIINAEETGHVLYRLTYNNVETEEGLGFYLGVVKDAEGNVISNNGSQLKATPNKAYLNVTTEAATKPASAALTRGFVFSGDDETTAIDEIVIEGDAGISGSVNADGSIYNLQGQQVSAPTKGLYIKNNKKVIIK